MKTKVFILMILFVLSPIGAQRNKNVKIHASFGLSNKTETLLKTVKKMDQSNGTYVLNKNDISGLLEILKKTDVCIKATIENISNKRTIAYKKLRTIDAISGQREVEIIRSFSIGIGVATGRKLDVALSNENGFLAFINSSGDLVFSRDGALFINIDGFIVNRMGYFIYPKIQLSQIDLVENLNIAEDGIFSVKDDMNEFKKVGQIKIFTFQNLEALHFEKECNCFLSTHSKQNPIENIPGLNHTAVLLSGFLELSNVNIVEEQVNYLELIRFYNLIYDTLTRLDPSFAGVYKTQVYDSKYVDSLNINLK